MKSSTAFGRFIYLFATFTALFVAVCVLFWIMDSDRSPVSVLDNMDADLDCVLDDLTYATPTTSTPTDVTPTAPTTVGKIRRCPCGRRMSSLTQDYHSCCIFCRGIDCTLDQRCDECLLVSDIQFNAYVKHQKSLKRRRLFNQKGKDKNQTSDPDVPPEFASVVSSSPPSVRSKTGDDNVVFTSTVSQNVGVTFDQVKELLGLFSKSFDDKFHAINSRIDVISQESNRSFVPTEYLPAE